MTAPDRSLLLVLSDACRDNCRDARALADVRRAQCAGLACSVLRSAADWWDDASLACHAARWASNVAAEAKQLARLAHAVEVACASEVAAASMSAIW